MSLAAGTASSAEANSKSRFAAMKSMLSGYCDIHLHAAPDSKARSLSEYDMALAAREAGYRAVLFKSNDFSCHDRAYLLRQAVPGIELFGSLVLNRCTGPTLNVYAVEQALKTTGSLCRCVWLPRSMRSTKLCAKAEAMPRQSRYATAQANYCPKSSASWSYAPKQTSFWPPVTRLRKSH